MNCKHCKRPLKETQYRDSDRLKSCPSCSTQHGTYHVYYGYPEGFGQTAKRSTPNHPEGPQSYCVPCRSGKYNLGNRYTCDQL